MASLSKGLLLGLGNPLLDIQANSDEHLLNKYSLKANDAILAEEKHLPLYKELSENDQAEFVAGGSCQNTMRAIQWNLKTPGTCSFMGCIGKDKYGEIIENKAKEQGVDVHYQYNESVPTGTCAVIITENGTKRSLCANLGAANTFKQEHLHEPENKAIVENAKFFYITGFFITVSPPSIMEVANEALNKDKLFAMNLSAPFICEFFLDPLLKALSYVDLLFGNETEAATFSKAVKLDTNNLEKIALYISKLPKENSKRKRMVVITQGADPVIVAYEDKIQLFNVDKLDPIQIVDTNGAGDAFAGGFLSKFISGEPLESCIKSAIFTAQTIVQQSGCTFP